MADYPLQPLGPRGLPQSYEPSPEPWLQGGGEAVFHEYWRILKKRSWVVAAVFAASLVAAALVALLTPRLYVAETRLLIEPDNPQVIDIPQVISESLGADSAYYKTQYELLSSRILAKEVISEQRLTGESLGAGGSAGPAGLIRASLAWLRPFAASSEDSGRRLVESYLDALSVEPIRNTRLVKLSFSSPDPRLSARIVNAHAKAHVEQGLEMRSRASDEARALLEMRLGELKSEVVESEAVLNLYARDHGIVSLSDGANIVVERLADLNERLTEAQMARLEREAAWQLVRQRRATSLPAVLESELIATLKENLATLEGEYAYLSSRFTPGYPRLAQLRAKIAEGRRRLDTEIQAIVAGTESAFLAAKETEDELRAAVETQKTEALRLKDASVEYALLAYDAEASHQLYDNVRSRIRETKIAADLPASNVFIVEEADPPLSPSSPRVALIVALALVLGLVGGIGTAFVAEYLDSRIRTPREIEVLGLASLGFVPDLLKIEAEQPGRPSRRLLAGGSEAVAEAASRSSPFDSGPSVSEAYRAIRTNIMLSQADEPPRTLLFTSASEGEGKTTTTLNTAAMFAQLGVPVLVIDADLRKPACHVRLGVPPGVGLTELLTGSHLHPGNIEAVQGGFCLLRSGKRPPNPTELLGSNRMKEVITRAREKFEYILIDGPPMMPVSDGVLLSTLVDGVIVVADQVKTPRSALGDVGRRLTYARAKVLGVVLNRAELDELEDSYFVGWERFS